MLNKFIKSIYVFVLTAFLFVLSGCEMPASWNDPAYFGPDENLGKEMGGTGTGNETWKFDW